MAVVPSSSPASPPSIQIALQGGGAKIVALFAAMEGVQKLQREGRVRVSRVSGTSAGAIVATMLAAGLDMRTMRMLAVNEVLPSAVKTFRPPALSDFIWKVGVRRRPLWDERYLAGLLSRFFADAEVKTLGDIFEKTGIHACVVASVLSDTRKISYSDSSDPKKPIVSALLDSAALPFCFRLWQQTGSVIVDGGLCENLPIDDLIQHQEEDGPVVAFSFPSSWPGTQTNLRQFGAALLETAIGNSVARARAQVGHERVCEIKTAVTTFDFAAAAAFSNADAAVIASDAKAFILDVLGTRRTIKGDPWTEVSPTTLEAWWRVYQSQHGTRRAAKTWHSSVVVQVNGLASEGETMWGRPDVVDYTVRFSPVEEMLCSHVSLIASDDACASLHESQIELKTADADPVDFTVVPSRNSEQPGSRPALLFFTPPLIPDKDRRYVQRVVQDVPGFMSPLVSKQRDEIFLKPRPSAGPVDRIDLVLHIPSRFRSARMIQQSGGGGRPMTAKELEAYPAPKGYRALGWCGESLESNQKFACDIIL